MPYLEKCWVYCSLRSTVGTPGFWPSVPPIILVFPENQTRIKLNSELDHVGPFPILEARSFLTSHWGTQYSYVKNVSWFTRKTWILLRTNLRTAVPPSTCRMNGRWISLEKLCSWQRKLVSTRQTGVRATVTQSPMNVKSHTKPPTIGCQKSLVSCLSCMKCIANRWITQPEGSGLQMYKVTSLDPRQEEHKLGQLKTNVRSRHVETW